MTKGDHPEGIVELMHAEIDGTNAPEQTRQLNEYLAAHADARRDFEELRALATHLDAQPHVDPPAHLIHRILAAIPFGRYPKAGSERGLGAWLSVAFPRRRLRYVAAFALGVVAGCILLWSTVSSRYVDSPLDVTNLYGTMRTIEPTDGFKVVGTAGVDLGPVRGEIRLHESDRKLMAEVSLRASDPIEWVLHYGPDVAFEGYRQVAGAAGAVTAAGTEMRVSQAGEGRFILFFTETDGSVTPMSIEIFESGKLIYQKQFVDARG